MSEAVYIIAGMVIIAGLALLLYVVCEGARRHWRHKRRLRARGGSIVHHKGQWRAP